MCIFVCFLKPHWLTKQPTWVLLKKKITQHILKMVRQTFRRGYYNGVFWSGKESGLNSKYKEKWKFIARE